MRIRGHDRGIYSHSTYLYSVLSIYSGFDIRMYVSGVESKLPNGVMLPVKYTEQSTTSYRARNIHGYSTIYSVLSEHCHYSSILFYLLYSGQLRCHPFILLVMCTARV